ncbi:hypothetical protein [Streptomyces griseoluteus]|uniref:hypothetical protein n=1 Tax=Streptomyces griseoluteus TaxID=29306 RepID=UPI001986FC86|nr:hypothetical protein [Streptomyces griseoluteus]GHF33503.1 hypothetical protein GCM10017776_60010 [Streptomyces griseoluteus]
MTIEPVTEIGGGGALRLPRARVVPLSAPPASYTAAVERYLTGAGIAKSSARVYRISLTTWGWMLAGEPAPTGPARRGAKPPVFPVAAIDDPALPMVLAERAAARADEMDADAVNRELSIARKAIGWWQRQGWIEGDPTIGIERRPGPPDRTKALAENQIAALWRLDVAMREKTFWKMLYESAARADEVLCLNVEDLPAGQARQDHRQGWGDGMDSLAVRHRPAAAQVDRPPHPRPAVPHRPQGPGRDADARRMPRDRPGPALLPPG